MKAPRRSSSPGARAWRSPRLKPHLGRARRRSQPGAVGGAEVARPPGAVRKPDAQVPGGDVRLHVAQAGVVRGERAHNAPRASRVHPMGLPHDVPLADANEPQAGRDAGARTGIAAVKRGRRRRGSARAKGVPLPLKQVVHGRSGSPLSSQRPQRARAQAPGPAGHQRAPGHGRPSPQTAARANRETQRPRPRQRPARARAPRRACPR